MDSPSFYDSERKLTNRSMPAAAPAPRCLSVLDERVVRGLAVTCTEIAPSVRSWNACVRALRGCLSSFFLNKTLKMFYSSFCILPFPRAQLSKMASTTSTLRDGTNKGTQTEHTNITNAQLDFVGTLARFVFCRLNAPMKTC